MSWWKKLVKIGQSVLKSDKIVNNPLQLSPEFLEALSDVFAPLNELDEQLSLKAMRFVVDGTDEDVLVRLAGLQAAAEKLGYGKTITPFLSPSKVRTARAEVMVFDEQVHPSVWIRYIQTLTAASKAGGHTLSVQANYPDWLYVLMSEILTSYYEKNRMSPGNFHPWSALKLEEIFIEAGLPGDLLIDPILSRQAGTLFHGPMYYYQSSACLNALRFVGEYFQKYSERIKNLLSSAGTDDRVYALNALSTVEYDCSPIVDLLVRIGTGPAKSCRDAALPLMVICRNAVRPLLEKSLAGGAAADRHEAVSLLWRIYGQESLELLQAHLQVEKSERVRQTIQKYIATSEAAAASSPSTWELPPLNLELGEFALSADTKTKIRQHFDKGYAALVKQFEQQMKQWESPTRPAWMRTKPLEPVRLPDAIFYQIICFIEGSEKTLVLGNEHRHLLRIAGNPPPEVCTPEKLKLVQLLRLLYAAGILSISKVNQEKHLWWSERQSLENYRNQSRNSFGLRELDAIVATLPDAESGMVIDSYLRYNGKWHSFCDWEKEAIWPAFAERPERLRDILLPPAGRPASYDYTAGTKRQNAFQVLSMFPEVPGEFLPLLWDLALGEARSDRLAAQTALNAVPGKAGKIKGSLKDGKAEIRAAAAEWLGRTGDADAIAPIKEAFAKEKSEMVKGAFMLALDALKADVSEFLKRDELAAEAKSGLSKKRPKGMEWVPLESLPPVHWQDTGAQLEPEVVQWWVVQSIQQRSPVCGPILKRYLSMCRKTEISALARFILTSWIGRDTSALPAEEAAEKARAETDKFWNLYGQNKYYLDLYKGDKENLYKEFYKKFSTEPTCSAIDQKGMLALVASGGDADCVRLAEQYIRTWFGNRLAQCKSLIEVLASTDQPLALQALLAFANRFRTKAIKELAQQEVQAIADRKGWTIDELADRTMPDGGFERPVNEEGEPVGDQAVLILDFGPRQFEVRLDDELEPVICPSGETKPLKALPAPGKNDDPEKAGSAKKAFQEAKKIVKEVVKRQKERLYEAVCTQRSWSFGDWQRYLARHPICGRLCTRLAWAAFAPPATIGEAGNGTLKFLGCFRPLEDGSLTNEKDEEVKLPEDALVILAHTCNTPAELAGSWLKHIQDYDVPVLFPQFGRPIYSLPEQRAKETDITDFEGHALTTFKLRAKAGKLGYVRGEAEDGGCFCIYRKSFSSLSIQSVLEFTGSYLPEEDLPAALTSFYFVRSEKEQGYSFAPNKLPLGKVPPVLLSECYNDIKQIAGEGSGYDPQWKEKSLF